MYVMVTLKLLSKYSCRDFPIFIYLLKFRLSFCHPPKRSTPLHEIRNTPPAFVMKRDKVRGTTTVVWDSTIQIPDHPIPPTIPLFSPTELAPTFHDGATAAILGCPHYARSCKLVHPSSGRLHTCRLCCDQERSKIGGIQVRF